MRLTTLTIPCLTLAGFVLFSACRKVDQPPAEPAAVTEEPAASSALTALFLEATPADARDVLAMHAEAQPGDTVVVQGRVKDFVDGMAVFTVTDSSKVPCIPENCATPWDYCCIAANEIALATTTVELHGTDGIVRESVQGFSGLANLDHVVVQGVFQRDDAGNTTVRATGLFKGPTSTPDDSE